ncbi:MAG TPA: glycosyltransferase family 39 protein [Candidatus Limnocylindria bacterium]|nr:glycosyltransferase family 39 protein [Candidatus Limnocylindria bacterium]
MAATFSIAAACAFLYCLGLARAGFYDNEGRFAEVARQMLVRGEFVTPYLNGIPFLNKPPLTAYLAAAVLSFGGAPEWARVVSVAAAAVTLVATACLGARLYGPAHGLAALVLLATSAGFVLEARTLRPDGLLVAAMAVALLCLWHAEHGARARTAWLVGFYAAIGVGMLAKGLLPLVLLGPPVAAVMLGTYGLSGVWRLRPGLGCAVLAAIVLPWHVLVAWRNPGFAWDFMVNQHLLFAFDKKEPRDSEGVSLAVFAGAFVARAAPWIALLPLAVRRARGGGVDPWRLVPWLWMLTPLGLFALTPSRLEHYSLPALPAVALLAAGPALALARGERGAVRGVVLLLALTAVAGGLALLVRGSQLLEAIPWLEETPGLVPLPPIAGGILLAGGAAIGAAALVRRGRLALAALVATTAAFEAVVVAGTVAVAPLLSWKGVAGAIVSRVGRDAEIVFEAPVEYQLVGGLDFYLQRDVTLLEPAGGFVPPTYLEGRVEGMFIDRMELERRWQEAAPVVFVSDPTRRRDRPEELVPEPFVVLARFGNRWVLGNAAVAR